MNHLTGRRSIGLGDVGAWALIALTVGGLGCHRRHRDARAPEAEVAASGDAAPEPAPAPSPNAANAPATDDGSGSGSGSGAPPAVDASQGGAAIPPPPGPPPSGPPRRSAKEKAGDVGVAVSTGVKALVNTVAANVPHSEVHVGASVSASTQCYDHDCNGSRTGRKCFGDHASYCASLCRESNCVSRTACQSECR